MKEAPLHEVCEVLRCVLPEKQIAWALKHNPALLRKSEIHYIYGIFNRTTNELVYVGRTLYPEDRWKVHSRRFSRLYVGHALEMEFLQITSHRHCDEVEMFWIDYFRFIGCDLANKDVNKMYYSRHILIKIRKEAP